MTGWIENELTTVLLAFVRFGLCVMLVPAIGSARVPVRFRLLIALALAISLAPRNQALDLAPLGLALVMTNEAIIGGVIGGAVRFFVYAINFAGSLIAAHLGLMFVAPSSVDDHEPAPHLADLMLVMAITALLLTDTHLLLIRTLYESYVVSPVGSPSLQDLDVGTVAGNLGRACYLGLQFAAPLIALSILCNLVLGVLNRALPMVPIQFVGAPALLLVGAVLAGDIAPLMGQRLLMVLSVGLGTP